MLQAQKFLDIWRDLRNVKFLRMKLDGPMSILFSTREEASGSIVVGWIAPSSPSSFTAPW
ncbi:hypothetical protein IF2G_04637 [Cordyceps javanica]|nr:hypothetical protein IF2G_04637 [Cordyceps javanica]